MENKPFQEFERQIKQLFQEKNYVKALEMIQSNFEHYSVHNILLHYWLMSLYARLGKFEESLNSFENSLEIGNWYSDFLLQDSNALNNFQVNPAFIELTRKNRQIREDDLQNTFKALITHSEDYCTSLESSCPLLVALHAEGSNAKIAINFWQDVAKLGWLVAAPQSHQALWKDAYLWIDRDLAEKEIIHQIKSLRDKYYTDPDMTIIAGRLTSVPIAIQTSFEHSTGIQGFIACDPPNLNQELDKWSTLIENIPTRSLRGYFLLHENNNTEYIAEISHLVDTLTNIGIWSEMEIINNGIKDISTPLPKNILSRALTFLVSP
jgi:tetratricopeptide (TPR) repeat protein